MNKTKLNFSSGTSKGLLATLAILIVLVGLVSGTVAFLATTTPPKENAFTYGQVRSEVIETFNGTTKSDVQIKNTGNTDAYIRATIVISFQNATGDVHSKQPVQGTDYFIDFGTSDWTVGSDGYYYYGPVVSSGSTTTNLIDSLSSNNTAPQGYTLSVEILGDSIQSSPEAAVIDSWGVTVTNGRISKYEDE